MHKLINDLDELYKREKRGKQFDLLVCRLVQFSESDLDLGKVTPEDLPSVLEQWFVASADVEPNSSCLCSQGEIGREEVKYVTYIKNRYTGFVARVGSTCVDKFGEGNSIQEEVKLLFSLMKNHTVRVNSHLAERMANQGIITQLELALIKELGRKSKLEQDAIDTLSVLKAKIAIEKIPPSVTDIAEWINDFVNKNPDESGFTSPYDNKNVTVSKRLIGEYRELRKKLLVADASEYEKQTVIRLLGAFYSHKFDLTPEPKKERPNLEQCQLDKLQVNQCDADQMIHAAEIKVENYLESRNKNTKERAIYTVLSVLLDAYHRFNGVTYNIDLLDGIQESIARLEIEIEKLSSTIGVSFSKVEEELKGTLYENIDKIESEIRQKHDALEQELQQVKKRFFKEIESTVNDSKKLLSEVEAELKKLKKETDNLVNEYILNTRKIEKDIWSSINHRNRQIDLLKEAVEDEQSNIKELEGKIYSIEELTQDNQSDAVHLNKKINELETNSRVNSEKLKSDLNALVTAISNVDIVTKKELKQARGKFELWGIGITFLVFFIFSLIAFQMNTRLKQLEIDQEQRVNPTLRSR